MAWATRPTYEMLTAASASGWCTEPGDATLIPAGYTVMLTIQGGAAPVLVSQDPTVGAFIRASLPPGVLAARDYRPYVPAWYPEGAVGRFAIGQWAIGVMKPTHGRLIPQPDVNGLHVGYLEVR